ncbi:MAG: PDZ domain-containing protein [Planctomycetota bacterium]|jgi:hypothetical protein
MRALAVVLVLSVPLAADDASSLQEAVELFKSPDASQRTAGSQQAERALHRLLAPLLEALKDDDPEVRRRARRAILSLVPGEVEKKKKPDRSVWVAAIGLRGGVGQAFRGRRGRRGFKAVVAKAVPVQPTQKQRAELRRIGTRLLPDLGVHWKARWRAPRMPGFTVHRVEDGSPAARLGLRKGDLIVRIGGVEVAEMGRRPKAVDWSRATVTVYREGRYVRLQAPHLPRK